MKWALKSSSKAARDISLERNGVVNNDIESLEVVLLFTDTQEEGLSWFQTISEGLNTGANRNKTESLGTILMAHYITKNLSASCENNWSIFKHCIPSNISTCLTAWLKLILGLLGPFAVGCLTGHCPILGEKQRIVRKTCMWNKLLFFLKILSDARPRGLQHSH